MPENPTVESLKTVAANFRRMLELKDVPDYDMQGDAKYYLIELARRETMIRKGAGILAAAETARTEMQAQREAHPDRLDVEKLAQAFETAAVEQAKIMADPARRAAYEAQVAASRDQYLSNVSGSVDTGPFLRRSQAWSSEPWQEFRFLPTTLQGIQDHQEAVAGYEGDPKEKEKQAGVLEKQFSLALHYVPNTVENGELRTHLNDYLNTLANPKDFTAEQWAKKQEGGLDRLALALKGKDHSQAMEDVRAAMAHAWEEYRRNEQVGERKQPGTPRVSWER